MIALDWFLKTEMLSYNFVYVLAPYSSSYVSLGSPLKYNEEFPMLYLVICTWNLKLPYVTVLLLVLLPNSAMHYHKGVPKTIGTF